MKTILTELDKLFQTASDQFDQAHAAANVAKNESVRIARTCDCYEQNGILKACLKMRPLIVKAIADAEHAPPEKVKTDETK